SPMPGLLREIAVHIGQEVKAGEKLALIAPRRSRS
ncbi:MAG: biotin/lipoyl-binding protein, partial [Rhodobacteraceae bacterium]|nr:biotin/lipoyl-binding protein [Paracoccaceae bacterium]